MSGEHEKAGKNDDLDEGSSPRERGALLGGAWLLRVGGIIPA